MLRLHQDPNTNNVNIVDRSYLTCNFKSKSEAAQTFIEDTVKSFRLNTEQKRAFRIVANHSVTPRCEQLKMYLGGMGGTGKSQVIKALIEFFKHRHESHRFVVLGPTGTSAALLGGSTYHSFLGIRISDNSGIQRESATTIAQIKGRIEGVDYIFLEVSMLACHELYKISSQLAKALSIYDLPFGGVNMIFAGDFAQLPPVGGAPLYSEHVGTQINSGLKPYHQEAAIGKALWHQFTTVVILRVNMRQKTQTPADAELRKALVNMRYGHCTPEDIKFLRQRVAGRRPEQPKISAKDFRNVAIICGVHSQKDMINQLGCERFALETGQQLTHFYSIDKWGKETDPASKNKWGKSKAASKVQHKSNDIDFEDQLEIWKLRHGATGHFAGKLSLCIGMPVMIRNNDATELCITKGQEGFVVGWQSSKGPHGKRVLDTLFVRLDNPPQSVQIPGLPPNIVPIVKSTKTVECAFPSDLKLSIERQQAWVLPNFAMTAHAAQGKTRPYNSVHLNSCYSHMSYYTALSRSASAAGTIILQGWDPKVITQGCSGYLRQEFREQELLDEITRLRYEGRFPEHIQDSLRNPLLFQFQEWKGVNYVPAKTDVSLKWSDNDPLILSTVPGSHWQLVGRSPNKKGIAQLTDKLASNFVPAKGTKSLPSLKHTLNEPTALPFKKQKMEQSDSDGEDDVPCGLVWDANNYSCAYDSLFVILYDIWIQDPRSWSRKFNAIGNEYLTALVEGFKMTFKGTLSLENVRDMIRTQLHDHDPVRFPMGQVGTSVNHLASTILRVNDPVASSQLLCLSCDYEGPEIDDSLGYVLHGDQSCLNSTSMWVSNIGHGQNGHCPECQSALTNSISYHSPPHLLIMEYPRQDIKTSHKIHVDTRTGSACLYLRGIAYFGQFHFTSRVVSVDGDIWYHDGMTTGDACDRDGHLGYMSDQRMRVCKGRSLTLAVYAQA